MIWLFISNTQTRKLCQHIFVKIPLYLQGCEILQDIVLFVKCVYSHAVNIYIIGVYCTCQYMNSCQSVYSTVRKECCVHSKLRFNPYTLRKPIQRWYPLHDHNAQRYHTPLLRVHIRVITYSSARARKFHVYNNAHRFHHYMGTAHIYAYIHVHTHIYMRICA